MNTDMIKNIASASAPTLLAIAIVTGVMGVWVPGTTYNKMEADRNEWKTLALQGLQKAEVKSIGMAPPVVHQSITKSEVKARLENVR